MKTELTIIVLSILLTGCVSVNKFDEQESALKACREQAQKDVQSLLDKQSCLLTELNNGKEKQSKLEADLIKTVEERDNCRKEYKEVQEYTRDIKKIANGLRQSLRIEIQEKNVEIENLKGKLSVRVLDRLLFKSGSAQILNEGKAILNKLATALQDSQDYIRIEGHTDTVPIGKQLKAKYYSNWELSAARAASVVRYFEFAHKFSPLRLEPVGFSKYRPVTEGQTPENLQRNRRVEIIVTQPRK